MPAVLTIGNFDGVHMGHRAILRAARTIAQQHDPADVVAVTFEPAPVAVLRPDEAPPRLSTPAEKHALLLEAGADRVCVLDADVDLLSISAEHFLDRLIDEHAPVAIVEGPDFRFGKQRAGDADLMRRRGRSAGYNVHIVGRVELPLGDGKLAPVSSSLARWLIGRGRVREAAAVLDRPYTLTAPVVRGEQRGRTIGLPTANLDPEHLANRLIPGDGVYAGRATFTDPAGTTHDHAAAISVGVKPTFQRRTLTVEAHLPTYHAPQPDALYGRTITLRFDRWLRDQQRFPSPAQLIAQLHRDVAAAAA